MAIINTTKETNIIILFEWNKTEVEKSSIIEPLVILFNSRKKKIYKNLK
jgi:hypothetical protein